MKEFSDLFKFDPTKAMCVGIERERFIVDEDGLIVPKSAEVLGLLPEGDRYGYELSACQLEDRVGPVRLHDVLGSLESNDREISIALKSLGLRDYFTEVAPFDMDLTVFKDPTNRYQEIVKNMPVETLRAACRVAGTHVHIGMPDMKTALKVYNGVINEWERLAGIIDGSHGERLKIYQQMAPRYKPVAYQSERDFYRDACDNGFDTDPRKNWQLIRITIHGTIEFRMGGATASHTLVNQFVKECYNSCDRVYAPLVSQFAW